MPDAAARGRAFGVRARAATMRRSSLQYVRYRLNVANNDTELDDVITNVTGMHSAPSIAGTVTGIGANAGYFTAAGDNIITDSSPAAHALTRIDNIGEGSIVVMARLFATTTPDAVEDYASWGLRLGTGMRWKLNNAGKHAVELMTPDTNTTVTAGATNELTDSAPHTLLGYVECSTGTTTVGASIDGGTMVTATATDEPGPQPAPSAVSGLTLLGSYNGVGNASNLLNGAATPSAGRLSDLWVIRSKDDRLLAIAQDLALEYAANPFEVPTLLGQF